jgi:hypothetical protein
MPRGRGQGGVRRGFEPVADEVPVVEEAPRSPRSSSAAAADWELRYTSANTCICRALLGVQGVAVVLLLGAAAWTTSAAEPAPELRPLGEGVELLSLRPAAVRALLPMDAEVEVLAGARNRT